MLIFILLILFACFFILNTFINATIKYLIVFHDNHKYV